MEDGHIGGWLVAVDFIEPECHPEDAQAGRENDHRHIGTNRVAAGGEFLHV
jgi:hypothetical protein